MTRNQLSESISVLMQKKGATIDELRALVANSKWELWWSIKKPERNINVCVTRPKAAKKGKKR